MDCLRGVAAVKSEVLDRVHSADLRVYLVWLPMLGSDTRDAALHSATLVPDGRSSHYWDSDMSLARSLGEALRIPPRKQGAAGTGAAWDVYLAYPRGVTWTTAPPSTFWMHQLRQVTDGRAPQLDGAALRSHVEALLAPAPATP